MNDPSFHLPRLSVLLVEDNELNRQVAEALLRGGGHAVESCVEGGGAIAAVERRFFDVILMDIHMPGVNGVEATRRIRAMADRRKSRIPIIALTANFAPEEVELYLEVGMNDVIKKPLRMGSIDEVLAPLFALPSQPESVAATAAAPVLDGERIGLLTEAIEAARLVELFRVARQSIDDSADQLRAAWRSADAPAAGRAAHRLAGVSANFGCMALAELARQIEADCRGGDDGRQRSQALADLLVASHEALTAALS